MAEQALRDVPTGFASDQKLFCSLTLQKRKKRPQGGPEPSDLSVDSRMRLPIVFPLPIRVSGQRSSPGS